MFNEKTTSIFAFISLILIAITMMVVIFSQPRVKAAFSSVGKKRQVSDKTETNTTQENQNEAENKEMPGA